MSTEHKAYEQILTDPDVLADYTCEFFGDQNGPYPVEEEQPAYGAPQAPTFAGQPDPESSSTSSGSCKTTDACSSSSTSCRRSWQDFWKDFGGAADRDPQNAWRYLNQAQQNPEVFRQKLLVME